jgi:acyl-CoA thioesterase FadM
MLLRTAVPVRFFDAGPGGWIDDVAILRIAGEARTMLLGAPPGIGTEMPGRSGVFAGLEGGTQLRILEHAVRFKRPLPYDPEPVLVDLTMPRIGPVTFHVGFRVHRSPDCLDYAVGSTEIALLRHGSVIRLPAHFRRQLQQFAAADSSD